MAEQARATPPFSFDYAFTHFRHTGGPPGFAWRYALAAGALLLASMALYIGVFSWLVVPGIRNAAASGELAPGTGARLGVFYAVSLLLSLLVFAVIEGSYLRHYMRGEGFSFRLGADELRLAAVYACWAVIWVLPFLPATLVLRRVGQAIPDLTQGDDAAATVQLEAAAASAAGAVGLSYLLSFAVLLVAGVRLAPAAAMTIRDRRVRFLSAWRETRGRYWALLGAMASWIGIMIAAYILFSIVALILVVSLAGLFVGQSADGGAVGGGLLAGASLFSIVFVLLILPLLALYYYVFAGPAALAARTYPQASQPPATT